MAGHKLTREQREQKAERWKRRHAKDLERRRVAAKQRDKASAW